MRRLLVVALLILGILGVVAGVVYFAEPAKSLTILPGHIAHSTVHRTHRGIAALVIGIALLVLAGFTAGMTTRRRRAPVV